MNRNFQITARQLVKMNEWAHREKQNRVLNIEDRFSTPETHPLKVDKYKNILLQPILFHTNIKGVQSWRCLVVFGVEGQEEPETSLLDVPLRFRRQILQTPIRADGSVGEPQKEITLFGGGTYELSDSESDSSSAE